jgi:DNA (cytosine-5)-methyltransferase 1
LSNFKPYITLSDAISDLPPIEENNFEYLSHKNKYQILLRNNSKKIYDHDFNNHGEKISKVLSSIKEGEGKNDFNRMVMDGIIDKKYYLTSGYANTYARL